MGLPLIVGAAAEYGVVKVVRFRERVDAGGPAIPRSTTLGVLFNGLTTMAGFASLLVAHHRGIWSLGLLLTIGAATSLVAARVVLPVLLEWAIARARGQGRLSSSPGARDRSAGPQAA